MRVKCSIRFFYLRKDAGQDNGYSCGPGSENKWCHVSENSPQCEWGKMAEKMMVTLAKSGHPVFQATSSLSRGMFFLKGGGISPDTLLCRTKKD